MNPSQQKYLRERLKEVERGRAASINGRYQETRLSDAQVRKALQTGRFALRPKLPSRLYFLRDALQFEGEVEADTQARDRELGALAKERQLLMDRIMLGDETEALSALEKFAAGA